MSGPALFSEEESVYDLIPPEQRRRKKAPLYKSQFPGNLPPTGSTFLTRGTSKPGGVLPITHLTATQCVCVCVCVLFFLALLSVCACSHDVCACVCVCGGDPWQECAMLGVTCWTLT